MCVCMTSNRNFVYGWDSHRSGGGKTSLCGQSSICSILSVLYLLLLCGLDNSGLSLVMIKAFSQSQYKDKADSPTYKGG